MAALDTIVEASPALAGFSRIRAALSDCRALAEAGIAALFDPDARELAPAANRVVFGIAEQPMLLVGVQPPQPLSLSSLTELDGQDVDLVFQGHSAVDLTALAGDGSRARAMLACEDALMAASPFPEELSLGFWVARREDHAWQISGAVMLAEPVLEVLDSLAIAGVKVKATRRTADLMSDDENVPCLEWAAVPPWIRASSNKRWTWPRLPLWVWPPAVAIVIFALFAATSIHRQHGAWRDAQTQSQVNRAANINAQKRLRTETAIIQARHHSLQQITLIGRLADVLPDDIWLQSVTIDEGIVELSGKAPSAAQALDLIAEIDELTDLRFDNAVTRDREDGGELFKISANLIVTSP